MLLLFERKTIQTINNLENLVKYSAYYSNYSASKYLK